MTTRRKRKQRIVPLLITYLLLVAGAIVFLIPFLWMLSASFKQFERVFDFPPSILPRQEERIKLGQQEYLVALYAPKQGARAVRVAVLRKRLGRASVRFLQGPRKDRTISVPEGRLKASMIVRFRWANYTEAWTSAPFNRFLINTLIVTISCIIGEILSCSLVAYSFARLRWPGRDVLFVVVLATMMLPRPVTMIPVFLLFRAFHWINTLLPLIVPTYFAVSGFYIFLLRQFLLTIPFELEEAARVDGASSFTILWRIMVPLCKPILAAIAVFAFIANWNEFLTPLIYLSSIEKQTLALGLRVFQGTYGSYLNLLMAASTVVLLPVLVIFFIAQRYFVRSITLTGMKA
jgi:ABC-type glycerol-3-phosphate transport system permease component